jgi:tRNA modification GTPase
VELATHGGVAVPTSIVSALVSAGARPAEPGEFTRRALLNGKIDLAQAEAVGDLIDARSAAMQRAALAQLDGGLSRRVRALRDAVIEVEGLVAYDIDFPEEDDGPVSRERIDAAARQAAGQVAGLLATSPAGELVRHGAVAVIAGVPNVGKSSLFNALLGRARSIVSEVPGTTRDAVDALIEPPGAPFPIRLVDTAGLRDTADAVEQLGIEVSRQALSEAHVVLACGETVQAVADAVDRVRGLTAAPVVGVRTKCDRPESVAWSARSGGGSRAAGRTAADSAGHPPRAALGTVGPTDAATRAVAADSHPGADRASLAATERRADLSVIETSAETGEGLRSLLVELVSVVAERWSVPPSQVPIVMRARHRHALEHAAAELTEFREAWAGRALPAVVAAVHLRAAATALEEIIGAIDAEDVLARVFAEFCVGK